MIAVVDGSLWFSENTANQIAQIVSAVSIREFVAPTPQGGPFGITEGPDGNVWFTEFAGDAIARLRINPTRPCPRVVPSRPPR